MFTLLVHTFECCVLITMTTAKMMKVPDYIVDKEHMYMEHIYMQHADRMKHAGGMS